jgi:peptidoglycan/LPS O-acetylase OafA/YrhL
VLPSPSQKTSQGKRAFYPALDGFRAIAFLAVFLHHYMHLAWGWSGVDLFFVLSGFLITGILFDARHESNRFRNFYVRRTLRIFPLYYGVMAALLITYPVLQWQWSWKWIVWPLYAGNFARFVHPYADASPLQRLADFQPLGTFHGLHVPLALGHFWSLCVEEQFYLLWPCIVFTIRDRIRLIWICAASLIVCLCMRILGQHILPQWMLDNGVLNRATPFRCDALLVGGLIALLLRGPGAERLLGASRKAVWPAILIAVVVIAGMCGGHVFRPSYPYPEWTFTYGLSALDILGALIVLTAIQPDSLLARSLNWSPLRWLGQISYGAYVLHDIPHPIFNWLGTHLSKGYGAEISAFMAFVFTLAAAWLSFRFYESRFLVLKERFAARGRPREAIAQSAR